MLHEKEYLILCDESDRRGQFFSNFYGGIRVAASQLPRIPERLSSIKAELGLTSEVKWAKTDPTVVNRYERFVEAFFEEVAAGHVVMRVMFTQNSLVPVGLTEEQRGQGYYILYYEFLKHGFGLRHAPLHSGQPKLRIYLDEIGDTKEQIAKFRGFIAGLTSDKFVRSLGFVLREEDITEVRSHDHLLLQALDVVLGSMSFRLNDKHICKNPQTGKRGNRTIAKERLYRFILSQIKTVTGKPNFNIGSSTGISAYPEGRWSDPYLHWKFIPSNFEYDSSPRVSGYKSQSINWLDFCGWKELKVEVVSSSWRGVFSKG